MRAACIVLAAGASTRMGHPKALSRIDGETAAARIASTCREAGLDEIIVVLGAHAPDVIPHLPEGVAHVLNASPEAGRTGSLQRGLLAARAGVVLVWPVDHPLVRAETVRALLATREAWVVPTFRGRGGHPLKLAGMALTAVETAPPGVPLRDLPAMVGLEVARLPVDDEGILQNLDTPEDLSRVRARKGI